MCQIIGSRQSLIDVLIEILAVTNQLPKISERVSLLFPMLNGAFTLVSPLLKGPFYLPPFFQVFSPSGYFALARLSVDNKFLLPTAHKLRARPFVWCIRQEWMRRPSGRGDLKILKRTKRYSRHKNVAYFAALNVSFMHRNLWWCSYGGGAKQMPGISLRVFDDF